VREARYEVGPTRVQDAHGEATACQGSSFWPHGAFPEERAYAVFERLHAGSLEALRVSRPEAVVLNKK
jgi:hypothetical protein